MSLHCSWRDMMREAAGRLQAAGVDGAARDVRLLLAHVLGVEPVDVILRETDAIDPVALTAFEAAVERRLTGEPVSRIKGWREFYGRRFIVTPDVLDPRPETELLVSEGIARLPVGGRVLDLGVGSGCILLSVLGERGDASGVGVDVSEAALAVARRNADALGVAPRVELVAGSWEQRLPEGFDLLLSNPPYIPTDEMRALARDVINYDPHVALTPGDDGLAAYRAILGQAGGQAGRVVRPGGWIGFEFGMGQGDGVARLMAGAGLENTALHDDLAGITRAAFGRRPLEAP